MRRPSFILGVFTAHRIRRSPRLPLGGKGELTPWILQFIYPTSRSCVQDGLLPGMHPVLTPLDYRRECPEGGNPQFIVFWRHRSLCLRRWRVERVEELNDQWLSKPALVNEVHGWELKETRLEIPDSTNTQRFHEQWNLVNTRSDGSNIPSSMDPYASNYTLTQY